MSSDNISNFIETTADLLDFAVEKLIEGKQFEDVVKYTKTTFSDLFQLIPQKKLPLAIVVYTGSTYANLPRRTAEISVLVIVSNKHTREEAQDSAQDKIDAVIAALDHEGENQFLFKVVSDVAYDFEDMGISAYEVKFQVEDH
jgi:hypothetical protein